MAAAAMLSPGLKDGRHFVSEVVFVVLAAERTLDVRQGLVEVTPQERDALDLQRVASGTCPLYNGEFLAPVRRRGVG